MQPIYPRRFAGTVLPVAALLYAMALPEGALAQEQQVETAALPYTSVTLTLTRESNPWYYSIVWKFATSDPEHHSVVCASGFEDLEYTLVDASGRIIPQAKDPAVHLLSDYPISSPGSGSQRPCEMKLSERTGFAHLSWFYPGLEAGAYTLQVTLAPKGSSDRAKIGTFAITISKRLRASAPDLDSNPWTSGHPLLRSLYAGPNADPCSRFTLGCNRLCPEFCVRG
jgi:hypothetical protein